MNNEDKIHINSFKFYDRDELEELTKQYYLENQKLKEMQCTFLGTGCQNKIKEYKEVIDKAIKYIDDNSWYYNDEDSGAMFCLEEEKAETFCNDLLKILKKGL